MKNLGVPPTLLMENAGRSVAEAVSGLLGDVTGKRVTVVCGKGRNGGDGFVAARHLFAAGSIVRVVLMARRSELGGETLFHYSILRRLASTTEARGRLSIAEGSAAGRSPQAEPPSSVIDALFGTGFHGNIRGASRKAVDWINGAGCPVIAVDLPSGLNSDDGSTGDMCVKARLTVSMGAWKTGLLLGHGPGVAGRVEIADLGIGMRSGWAPEECSFLIRGGDIGECLPVRSPQVHKHSVGKILALAGSVGLTGAAVLAATAAMKSGAGAVVLAVPKTVYPLIGKRCTEVMVKPVSDSSEGTFSNASLDSLRDELDWADVILVGPGVGMHNDVHRFMESLLKLKNKRFLIDADGLNHIAADKALLRDLKRNTCILTPHPGEFSRLSGHRGPEIEKKRMILAKKYAKNVGVCLVLKGSPTITATPAGTVFINSTGNPGMATAGMGDVLSGVISALWAESDNVQTSAYGGVFLHGLAGDLARSSYGTRPLMAGDVLNKLPEAIKMFELN